MKTIKDLFEVYKPKPEDEQKFVDKHVTIKHADKNGNGDDVFKATNIKKADRKGDRHGYEPGEDEAVYEEVEEVEEGASRNFASAIKKAEASRQRAIKRAAQHVKRGGSIENAIRDHDLSPKDADAIRKHAGISEEVEDLEELSSGTLRRYRMKSKSIADNEGPLNYREKGRELAGRKTYGGRINGVEKAKVMAKEETQIDEDSRTPQEKVDHAIRNHNHDMNRATSPAQRAELKDDHKAFLAAMKKKHPEVRVEEVQIDEISATTKDAYAQKAGKQLPGLFKKSGDDADSARKYYNRKNTVRKIANEEVEDLEELSVDKLDKYRSAARRDIIDADANDDTGTYNKRVKGYRDASKKVNKKLKEEVEVIEEGTMRLSKVHIVHHHDHPAAKEFAKHYTDAMKGDHREGGPTEKDEAASNKFHERYTGVRTREGFAGSGTHIYHDHKTGAKWKVDRHPNGKTFYGTDHIISHHTGNVHESVEDEDLYFTVAEEALLRGVAEYYSELGEELSLEQIGEIAEGLLNELSKNTVRSYYNKAGEQGRGIMSKMFAGGGDWSKDGKDTKTLYKRGQGRKMALKRRNGEVKMSEEAEQIDELSKKTLGSYVSKATTDVHNRAYRAGKKEGQGAGYDTDNLVKGIGRQVGISKAVKKLTKEDVINSTVAKFAVNESEEIPLDEQLVARIENLSEAHIHMILGLFDSLDESNQKNMIKLIDDGKVNDILDFAITSRTNGGE